jgi:hypothetical protein
VRQRRLSRQSLDLHDVQLTGRDLLGPREVSLTKAAFATA